MSIPPHSTPTIGQKLLTLREARGLSLRTLGERVELSPSFLSQVERDEASPSIASLERITRALGVDLATLFSDQRAHPIVRRHERDRVQSQASRGYIESLSHVPGRFQPRLVTLGAGGGTGFLAVDGGEIFALVVTGSLEARLRDQEFVLDEGDALHALPEHGLVEFVNVSRSDHPHGSSSPPSVQRSHSPGG